MTSLQALSCITTSLNEPLPTFDDLLSGSNSFFQVTKDPKDSHFTQPMKRSSKTAKKIAGQNTSFSAIVEPSMVE